VPARGQLRQLVRGQQRVLAGAPLGHIAEHQHHANELALAVADGRAAVVDGHLAAVAPQQHRVVGQPGHPPLAQHARHRAFHLGPRALVDDAEHLADGLAHGLGLRPAGEGLGHRVHEEDAALVVGGDDGIADALQRGREPPLIEGELASRVGHVRCLAATGVGKVCGAAAELWEVPAVLAEANPVKVMS